MYPNPNPNRVRVMLNLCTLPLTISNAILHIGLSLTLTINDLNRLGMFWMTSTLLILSPNPNPNTRDELISPIISSININPFQNALFHCYLYLLRGFRLPVLVRPYFCAHSEAWYAISGIPPCKQWCFMQFRQVEIMDNTPISHCSIVVNTQESTSAL